VGSGIAGTGYLSGNSREPVSGADYGPG